MDELSDTPVEVMRLQAAILARKTPEERWQLALGITDYVMSSSMNAILESVGGDQVAARVKFVQLHYGMALGAAFADALARRENPDPPLLQR